MKLTNAALAALSLASSSVAQLASFSPSSEKGVSYSVNIPSNSASSGSGDIYFQIQAPASKQWVGLGQGDQMQGANIFVVYADSSGTNVTLSPRLGKGEVEPLFDSNNQVFLLEGSGIANNVMTANVRCSNCASWNGGKMDFTSSSSSWIWAVKEGSPIKSDDKSADLQQHNSMDEFTLDLTKARGGSSLNPFLAAASTTNNPSGSGSGASPGATASGSSSSSASGSSSSDGDSDSSGSSSSSEGGGNMKMIHNATIAHGVIMGLAFVIFYPFGAMIMRLFSFRGLIWVHAGMQAFAYVLALAGLGLGIYIAITPEYRLNMYHPVIGLVVIACLLFQPMLGYIHHMLYMRTGQRTVWGTAHVWFGRVVLTLGIINGGLGLRFAANTTKGEIVYGVIAGFVWVSWVGVAIWAAVRHKGVEERSRAGKDATERNEPVMQQTQS